MSKRIVIALGGNALGSTAAEQLALVSKTAKAIVDLIAEGNEVVIAHGNGPQVGMINLGLSTAAEAGAIKADMPFPECGAMSEGYIGYHLQQAIGNELTARGIRKPVATIVTQTVVSQDDPAFQNPTKPVGAFYDKETADRIAAEKGYTMVEDAGRGYRQVVPSPSPLTSWRPSPSRPCSTPAMWSSPWAAAASPWCARTAGSAAPPPSSTRTSAASYWPSCWTLTCW